MRALSSFALSCCVVRSFVAAVADDMMTPSITRNNPSVSPVTLALFEDRWVMGVNVKTLTCSCMGETVGPLAACLCELPVWVAP